MAGLNDLLTFILPSAIALLVALTTGALIVRGGWRLSLLALASQYLASGLLLSWRVTLSVAALKWLAGTMVLLILYPAGRRTMWGAAYPVDGSVPGSHLGLTPAFRVGAAALLLVVTLGLLYRFPVEDLNPSMAFTSYWLLGAGLVVLFLARDPWITGAGLLIYQTGFEQIFIPTEQDLLLAGGMATLHIVVALALAYLITSKMAGAQREEG